jgi:hypothetical protein
VSSLPGARLLGDVAEGDGDALGRGEHAHVHHTADEADGGLGDVDGAARLHGLAKELLERRADDVRVHVPEVLPEELVARAAHEPLRVSVHVGEAPVAVDGVERLAHALEHRREPAARLLQEVGGSTLSGDVEVRGHGAARPALDVEQRDRGAEDGLVIAVVEHHLELDVGHLHALARRLLDGQLRGRELDAVAQQAVGERHLGDEARLREVRLAGRAHELRGGAVADDVRGRGIRGREHRDGDDVEDGLHVLRRLEEVGHEGRAGAVEDDHGAARAAVGHAPHVAVDDAVPAVAGQGDAERRALGPVAQGGDGVVEAGSGGRGGDEVAHPRPDGVAPRERARRRVALHDDPLVVEEEDRVGEPAHQRREERGRAGRAGARPRLDGLARRFGHGPDGGDGGRSNAMASRGVCAKAP